MNSQRVQCDTEEDRSAGPSHKLVGKHHLGGGSSVGKQRGKCAACKERQVGGKGNNSWLGLELRCVWQVRNREGDKHTAAGRSRRRHGGSACICTVRKRRVCWLRAQHVTMWQVLQAC